MFKQLQHDLQRLLTCYVEEIETKNIGINLNRFKLQPPQNKIKITIDPDFCEFLQFAAQVHR